MNPKGLSKYFNDKSTLKEKVTTENAEDMRSGADDSEVESVYYTYKQVRENSK